MSVAETGRTKATGGTARLPGSVLTVDVSFGNVVFALRTAVAAVVALAIAYWLDLSDPQWATLTVFVLAQPTVGAAMSKGAWRTAGTVVGGISGLVLVALFSQAAELLVAATSLMVGAAFYVGARLRNFAAYGVMIGSYTALLVAYEGSVDPINAWTVAVDRTSEILIGIACVTLASTTIMPRYAGDALRGALDRTLDGLAHYVAAALRLSTPLEVFAGMRRRMVAEVVSFDALRSYAMFESPEMRSGEWRLRRVVRQFLVVLSVARALYVRLDAADVDGAKEVRDRLAPTLQAISARVEEIAADPAGWRDTRQLRRELSAARLSLIKLEADFEAMAGTVPFAPLANGILIVNRVRELLRGLALVVVAETAHAGAFSGKPAARRVLAPAPSVRREALLVAARAAIAVLVLSAAWLATGWDYGFTAVSGGAIMLFFGVNQDDPTAAAKTYLVWSAVGILFAYLLMVFVLPHLEGFEALALVLVLALLPAGLMAGTPSHALAGIALGAFTIAEIGTGNVFAPDEIAFVNSAVALLLGMVGCLVVIVAIPVTSQARRGEAWRQAIGMVLPAVARGGLAPRLAAARIVATLSGLLGRLALDKQRDEEFFRGSLGAASSAVELGRLVSLAADPSMPADMAEALRLFLGRFADALERVAADSTDRKARLAEAEALVGTIGTALAARRPEGASEARAMLHAGASLRFIADRFTIDRAYLSRSFAEE